MIDIIITCHNHGRYLADAINSCMAQSAPCNIIVVNDGSTDETAKVMAAYHEHITAELTEHKGQAAAANAGIARGVARYVCRLDADDWLHEDFCLVMESYLDRHYQYAAVYSDYQREEDGDLEYVKQDDTPHGSCMVIRRDVVENLGGYEEHLDYQEDYDLWRRLEKSNQVAHIALPLWYYRQHDGQKSNAWNQRQTVRHDIKEQHGDAERVLAVIPARGNSKGISGKNLRLVAGVPLVTHAIRIAKACKHDMLIAVSTEDAEIAEVARGEGVEVIDRPIELSDDDMSTIGPVRHAMLHMDQQGWRADIVVSIQPTDPFTPPSALSAALERMDDPWIDSVVAIAEIRGTHPYRAYMLKDRDRLDPLFPTLVEKYQQRQDRPPTYGTTGGFYVRRRRLLEKWAGEGWALGADCRGVIVPEYAAVDIDSQLDLLLADTIARNWDKGGIFGLRPSTEKPSAGDSRKQERIVIW